MNSEDGVDGRWLVYNRFGDVVVWRFRRPSREVSGESETFAGDAAWYIQDEEETE